MQEFYSSQCKPPETRARAPQGGRIMTDFPPRRSQRPETTSSCVCSICVDWLLPPVKILWVEVTIQPVMAGRICNSIMLLALINLMHCETSIHQDQIPATTAQTTRDDRACTAEARIRTKFPTRRPKWPESRACVPQKGASGPDSSPDGPSNQKRERVHRGSAHQGQIV